MTTEEAREIRDIRMLEPTEHHRDERMVASPIPTPFSYASIDDCNEAEISFLQVAGE